MSDYKEEVYLYEEGEELRIFGSISALCQAKNLKPDRFYTHFGRNKNRVYDLKGIKISIIKIERSRLKK